jgi:pantoate--beta-alanine ligase
VTGGEGRPIVARTREELGEGLGRLRMEHGSIALVPTMGFLHSGHLSLIDRAGARAGAVVVSIFVNPLQFGPDEDLDRYPRDPERDLGLASARGARLVFLPADGIIYPDGTPRVSVDPGPGGDVLCGRFRPGHFRGVLTVVAKLFGLIRPDVAVFGRKDLQQAVLIERMVRDLELGVAIDVAPVVREADGLAMSSRNAILTPEERARAVALSAALHAADREFRGGLRSGRALRSKVEEQLADQPGVRLQYVEVVDPATLEPMESVTEGAVLAVAGFVGRTRLIDNLPLGVEAPDPRSAPASMAKSAP